MRTAAARVAGDDPVAFTAMLAAWCSGGCARGNGASQKRRYTGNRRYNGKECDAPMIDRRVTVPEIFPRGWKDSLGFGQFGVGADLATTTKKTSNPSAIALVERNGQDHFVRLLLRFKTADPEVFAAILGEFIALPEGRRVRRVCLDATSERFFAVGIQRKFAGRVPVELVVGSESIEYGGEKLNYKTYTGNLLVNCLEDNRLALPNETWLRNDLRLVQREKGGFDTAVAEDGSHGDTFDAIKLALHALSVGGGPAVAAPMRVGTFGAGTPPRPFKNPFARFFNTPGGTLNA
jgi:hypothetical protein